MRDGFAQKVSLARRWISFRNREAVRLNSRGQRPR